MRPYKYHSDEGPVVPEGTHLDEFGILPTQGQLVLQGWMEHWVHHQNLQG